MSLRKSFYTLIAFVMGIPLAWAAISPWNQTDWSGGVGTSTDTQVSALSDIDVSTVGEFQLAETSDWFDSDWKYRQTLIITNVGSAQTDYAVKITVPYAAEMQADFDDLRFTNSGGTELDYWLQKKTDSTEATIWIEIDSLAGTGDTAIIMYYGNDAAASASDGDETFEFFDDFSGGAIDLTKWTLGNIAGHATITAGELEIGPGTGSWSRAIYTSAKFARSDLAYEFDYRWTSANPSYDALMMGWKDDTASNSYTSLVYAYYNPGTGGCTVACADFVYEDGSNRGAVGGSWTKDTQYSIRLRMRTSGGAYYDQSDDAGDTYTTVYTSVYSTESDLHPGMTLHTGTHVFDNTRVRKWMDTEPTTAFGAIEERFKSTGTLTSNILLADDVGAVWQDLTFVVDATGTTTVKVRTSTSADMSGAPNFVDCDAVTSGSDISGNNCVTDGHNYIQYEVTLTSADAESPIFSDIEISYLSAALEADAGLDRIVVAGRSIILDGGASVGQGLSYFWAIFSGEGTLADPTSASPTFTAPAGAAAGETVVKVTVFDTFGQSATAELTLKIIPLASGAELSTPVSAQMQGLLFTDEMVTDVDGMERLAINVGDNVEILMPPGSDYYSADLSSSGTLAIGCPSASDGAGRVFIFKSPVEDLSGEFDLSNLPPATETQALQGLMAQKTIETEDLLATIGREPGDAFGRYVAVADLEGDGEEEILVSAPGAGDYGTLFIYDLEWNLLSVILGEEDYPISSLISADVVGSSLPDIIIGPANTALSRNLSTDEVAREEADTLFVLTGAELFDGVSSPSALGVDLEVTGTLYKAFAVGDVNGDGDNDLIMATAADEVLIFFGPFGDADSLKKSDADVVMSGAPVDVDFGTMIAAGDVNGDDIDDVVVGVPLAGEGQAGELYVIFGESTWESSIDVMTSPNVMVLTSDEANGQIGWDLLLADATEEGALQIYTLLDGETVMAFNLLGDPSDPSGDDPAPSSDLVGSGCTLEPGPAASGSPLGLLLGLLFVLLALPLRFRNSLSK